MELNNVQIDSIAGLLELIFEFALCKAITGICGLQNIKL